MKKTKSGWGRVSTAIVIALAVALNLIVVASAMAGLLSSTAYPTAAPLKIVQNLDEAAETDQVFTFEFTNTSNSKVYRQSIIVPAGSTSAETTVTLEAAKTYTMKLADKQSSWCYAEASAAASNVQTGDTFTATSGNLPYTITIADLTRQTTTRTITLTANKSATAMEGDTANVSNTMNAPVIKFDTQKHGNDPFYKIATSAKLTAPTETDYGSSTGLTLEGWYDNAACYGDAIDFTTKVFTENTTLYANWIPTKDSTDGNLSYWISPTYKYIAEGAKTAASTTANVASDTQKDRWNYVKEEWNVLKSKAEIQADMAVLSKGAGDTNPTYATVKAEWDEIMNSDKYHLYTVYTGGESEVSKNNLTSALNGYAEFRVIEVSGSAGHLNVANDTNSTDGSVVTFMAAHVLPTAYQMNSSDTNANGWSGTALRTSLQSGGTIYSKFKTAFTSDIQPVNKHNNAGGGVGQVAAGTTTNDAFWLISYSELYSTGTYASPSPKDEGTAYQWCKDKNINGSAANSVLINKTRAGFVPGSSSNNNGFWWERSPRADDSRYFIGVYTDGNPQYYSTASNLCGVTPCFSFGTPVLTFDANMPDDAENVTSATVSGVAKTTQRIDAGTQLTSSLIPADTEVVITKKDGATKTYVFAGWSENKNFDPTTMSPTNDDNPLTQAELAAKNITLNSSKTYYAIWMETNGFWLGTKEQNATYSADKGVHYYFNEAQFKKWDVNYVNSETILTDMAAMEAENTTTDAYTTAYNKWKNYYDNADVTTAGAGNQVRLYSTFTEDGTGTDLSASENMYAEFRIIEVSGAAGHLKTAGDTLSGDGSVVTFMATHALPTAKAMGIISAADEGWGNTAMRTEVMKNYVAAGMSALSEHVYTTPKVATSGTQSSGWVEGSTTLDDFWLLSYSELFGETSTWITGSNKYFKAEGTQYAWCKSKVTNPTGNNSSLTSNYTTREGKVVDTSSGCWWLRSPFVGTATVPCFGRVLSAGQPGNYTATSTYGVVPCFSFGSPQVTFDANAPTGTTATVDGTNATVTKRVTSGTALDASLIPDDDGLTCTTTDDSGKTYVFAGWSKTKTHAITYNDSENPWTEAELEATSTTITGTEVYYAIWLETNGFWLGTQDQSAILDTDTSTHYFFNEAQFAKWDVNYVPGSTILSDMNTLLDESSDDWVNASIRWTGYYNGADTASDKEHYKDEGYNVRLYATYDGGKDETDYSGNKSDENMYVEFRIMEVDDHLNVAGDEGSKDGSVVTFMATHVLPKKYVYNAESTSVGWGSTTLRTAMNASDGDIFKRFPTALSSAIYNAPKLCVSDGNSATSYDKFWITSNGELTTTGELGNQYAWANGKVTNLSNNSVLEYKTRDKTLSSAQTWWLRSTSTSYPTVVSGTGDPANSGTYSDTLGVVPSFSFGSPIVTFNANLPDGATSGGVDGTNNIKTVRKTASTTLTAAEIPDDSGVNCTVDGATYQFAGWSTDKNAEVPDALYEDELVDAATPVEHNTTYYAIWHKASGFWLGTKGQKATAASTTAKSSTYFDKEVKFAKYDQNYHNADEILADMAAMETDNTSASTYTAAKTKWDTYYANADLTTAGVDNQIRLYSDYSGGTGENMYVEFRIVEVSGADGHLNDSSDSSSSDGSVVTFAATHSLPTGNAMSLTSTNADGWGVTNLRTLMNETTTDGVTTQGTIFKQFPTNLTSNILEASKVATTGNKTDGWVKGTTTSDKLWLLSYSEIFGEGSDWITRTSPYFNAEGTQYTWYKTNVTSATSSNTKLANNYKTRAGKLPTSNPVNDGYNWWLRSPYLTLSNTFGYVNNSGSPYYVTPNACYGVVPAFSFGSPQVTFDSNAPEGTTATVDGTNAKVKKRVVSGNALQKSQIPDDANVKCTATDDTYYFAGWSTDKDAAVKGSLDKEELYESVKDTPVTGNVTYYAVWLKKGFWLGTANADASSTGKFQTQVDFAKYDDNYVSQDDILADMEVLEKTTNATYDTVKSKWDGYYTNQDSATAGEGLQVHLYTWWNKTTDESSSAVTTNGNQFVEFRIVEVSGAAGHNNVKDDASSTDGSVVTFAATHALPTAKAMNAKATATGGWKESAMRNDVFANYVSTGLSDLSDYALEVPKVYSYRDVNLWATSTASDKFWMLSNSEVFGTGTNNTAIGEYFLEEGAQYAWFSDKGVNAKNGLGSSDEANDALSGMGLTRAGSDAVSESSNGDDDWWLRTYFKIGDSFAMTYKADSYPCSTFAKANNYSGVVPAFSFGSPVVTFDANAPEGATATLDSGASLSKQTSRVSMGDKLTSDIIPDDGNLKCTSTDGKTYVFAGWSESKTAAISLNSESNPLTEAELAAKEVAINSTKTYYAIWMETGDFWLGTKDQKVAVDSTTHHSFFNEAQFAKWDANYANSESILADMAAMETNDTSASTYTTAKTKWDGYLTNSDSSTTGAGYQVRLYATYEGGKDEIESTGNASDENMYVEFRIAEVSGAAGHKNSSTTYDGSVVTFAATHSLPTAYAMNTTSASNANGWGVTNVHDLMNKTDGSGTIYDKFPTNLTSNIFEASKVATSGSYGNWVKGTTTTDKLWLLSYSEVFGEESSYITRSSPYFNAEGTQYAWYKANITNPTGANTVMRNNYLTRAQHYPGGCTSSNNSMSLRSPWLQNATMFGYVTWEGDASAGSASTKYTVAPAFAFGTPQVTFDANMPSGATSATIDGTNTTKTVRVSNGGSLTNDQVPDDAGVTCTASGKTYVFAGWSTSKSVDDIKTTLTKKDFIDNPPTFSNNTTYYAIWMESTGFWLGSADQTATVDSSYDEYYFFNEAQFKKHDENYVSAADILTDMNVLKDSSNTSYTTTKDKWDDYFTNADEESSSTNYRKQNYNVRLYTNWNTATNESSSAVTTGENIYAEFRILEVSGAAGHMTEKDSDGDGIAGSNDGSVVTFAATHALPTAKAMNSDSSNAGGWASSAMRTEVMANYVSTGLSNLAGSVTEAQKIGVTGNITDGWVEGTTTSDKFWLLSNSEVFGTSSDGNTLISGSPKYFYDEGTRYAWFTQNGVNATSGWSSTNAAIQNCYKTRAGGTPVDAGENWWWLRSPCVQGSNTFGFVNANGSADGTVASASYGVVPAFSFGTPMLRWDANAPTGTTATVDGTNSKTATRITDTSTGITLSTSNIPAEGSATCSSNKWVCVGWSTDKTAEPGDSDVYTQATLAAKNLTVKTNTTYYAVWKEVDFWLGTNNSSYYKKSQFIDNNDVNYVSSDDILADMEILKEGSSNSKYDETLAKWQGYYENQDSSTTGKGYQVRLYSTWSGSDVTSSTSVNNLVQFRILQVGDHDNDGSFVTFGATHLLPTGQAMKSTNINTGGWQDSQMRKTTMASYVEAGLAPNLVESVFATPKLSTSGSSSLWVPNTETADKFWLLSNSEIYGKASDGNTYITSDKYYYDEGSRYDWFTDKGVTSSSYSAIGGMNIRRDQVRIVSYWFTRSPVLKSANYFGTVQASGANYVVANTNGKNGIVPCFSFGKSSVTFDANAPSGTEATVDGENKTLSFTPSGSTLTADEVSTLSDTLTCSVDGTTDSTYEFAGWALTPGAGTDDVVAANKVALVGKSSAGKKTYYAVWKDKNTELNTGFWMADVDKNASSKASQGTQESYYTDYSHYLSSKQILADVAVMNAGSSDSQYARVIEKWNEYYSKDIRLYSTYTGGASETAYDGSTTSAVNGLVDFRIMEVSGEAGHLNTSGDATSSDGSVVTFIATHALPTAEVVNSTNTNVGGWNATELRAKLQSGGEIYDKFPTALTNAINPVQKLNNIGGSSSTQTSAGTTTVDKFWLPSYSELYNTGTYWSYAPKNEGTAYQWCKDKNINGNSSNTALTYTTRSGGVPGSSTHNGCYGLMRSPYVGSATDFTNVTSNGTPKGYGGATDKRGVVPCFTFGSNTMVTFDANAPSGTTATVDGSNATAKVIASGSNSTLSSSDVSGLNATLTCGDTTYTFAGWAKSPGASNTTNTDSNPGVIATSSTGMAGQTVTNGETYYAIWKDTNTTLNTGFWMSDAEATASKTAESQYTSDGHYMSSKQILADVAVMNAGSSDSQYARVIEKWNEYYDKDIRLYSTWSGSDATAGTLNALVDFRILQVGEHDSDGSVVTFMATHSLPTAKAMMSKETNAGGWGSSALRTAMTDYVQAGLSSSLVSAMNPVQKVATSGSYDSWVEGSTTLDTLWLASYSEIFGETASGIETYGFFKVEGTQYAWCKSNVGAANDNNTSIQNNYKTRGGDTPSDSWWLRSPFVEYNNYFEYIDESGMGFDGYTTKTRGVVPCFTFGNNALVTFDANAPSGTTATVDGTNAVTNTMVEPGTTLTSDMIPADTAPTCSETDYQFVGWAESKTASPADAKKNSALADDSVSITGRKTYYAVWIKPDFWLSSTNTTGTKQTDFTSDSNYRSSTDILDDIAILKDPSNSNYSTVLTRWQGYYSNDVKLYADWIGTDVTDSTSVNKLVEFRILQVGEHDSDGSVVTFGATHSLPTSKKMNDSATNAGGWESSAMRNSVMSDYVQAGLPSSLVSAAKSVNKVTASVSGSSVTQGTTSDKFWLLSNSEVFGTAADGNTMISGTTKYFNDEGTRYAWFTDKGVNAKNGWTSSNTELSSNCKTRAGDKPAGADNTSWWLRSPRFNDDSYFGLVYDKDGNPGNGFANLSFGVVPALAM